MFPKYKKGGHIVRNVLTDPTYGNCIQKKTPHKPFATFFIAGYISELVNETVRVCDQGRSMPLYIQQLSSLSSCYEKPDKISAIVRHKS